MSKIPEILDYPRPMRAERTSEQRHDGRVRLIWVGVIAVTLGIGTLAGWMCPWQSSSISSSASSAVWRLGQ